VEPKPSASSVPDDPAANAMQDLVEPRDVAGDSSSATNRADNAMQVELRDELVDSSPAAPAAASTSHGRPWMFDSDGMSSTVDVHTEAFDVVRERDEADSADVPTEASLVVRVGEPATAAAVNARRLGPATPRLRGWSGSWRKLPS